MVLELEFALLSFKLPTLPHRINFITGTENESEGYVFPYKQLVNFHDPHSYLVSLNSPHCSSSTAPSPYPLTPPSPLYTTLTVLPPPCFPLSGRLF